MITSEWTTVFVCPYIFGKSYHIVKSEPCPCVSGMPLCSGLWLLPVCAVINYECDNPVCLYYDPDYEQWPRIMDVHDHVLCTCVLLLQPTQYNTPPINEKGPRLTRYYLHGGPFSVERWHWHGIGCCSDKVGGGHVRTSVSLLGWERVYQPNKYLLSCGPKVWSLSEGGV